MSNSILERPEVNARLAGSRCSAEPAYAPELNPALEIPLSLEDWVPQEMIESWVLEEVAKLDWCDQGLSGVPVPDQVLHPRAMVALHVFSYVSGTFDSESIIRRCKSPGPFRSFAQGVIPYTRDLETFRRRNRALIISLVASVLARAVRQKFGFAEPVLPFWLETRLHEQAIERLIIARHLDNCG